MVQNALINDDKFYWLARLLTAHLDDHLQAAEALAPTLKEWARERGLSAGGLWAKMKKEMIDKFGEDLPPNWWRK